MRQVYYRAEREHWNAVIQMANNFYTLLGTDKISDIQLRTDKFDDESERIWKKWNGMKENRRTIKIDRFIGMCMCSTWLVDGLSCKVNFPVFIRIIFSTRKYFSRATEANIKSFNENKMNQLQSFHKIDWIKQYVAIHCPNEMQ